MGALDKVKDSDESTSDVPRQSRWFGGSSRDLFRDVAKSDTNTASVDTWPQDEAQDLATKRSGSASVRDAPGSGPMDQASDAAPDILSQAARRAADSRESIYSEVKYRVDPTFRDPGGHIDAAYRVALDDGRLAWLKPSAGETDSGRQGIEPGGGARRSMASYEVDRALGLNVTPEIRLIQTVEGDASIQDHAPLAARPVDYYDKQDAQRMAVLDYVTGQTDRHGENYRTCLDGRPAAIDNSLCLSTSNADSIRSDFVVEYFRQPLDSELIRQVRECDTHALGATLNNLGIDEANAQGVLDRIEEVAREGAIMGQMWRGRILDGDGAHGVKWAVEEIDL